MAIIKTLSPEEIRKIAAGQVVERPANIVKELVENAIDAGSTVISVFIEDGGKKLIRVLDNGFGMDKIDAQACFEKHATSKIQTVNELTTITTFGFRGEALASIAAVSKVTLITRHTLDEPGTLVIHENNSLSLHQAAGNIGTDITIENLFYNTPGRLKFLKNDTTEQRHIVQLIQAFCFSHPSIHFKLFSHQKIIINSSPTQNIKDKASLLFPYNPTLLTFSNTRKDNSVTITGVISNQHYGVYDRSSIFCIVNKRWVKNYNLASALIKGCKNVIPHGKFPAGVLLITIDPNLVDINTHPRKEEVVFVHPRIVEQLIETTITNTFEEAVSTHIAPQSQIRSVVDYGFNHYAKTEPFFDQSLLYKNIVNDTTAQTTSIDDFIPREKRDFVKLIEETSVQKPADQINKTYLNPFDEHNNLKHDNQTDISKDTQHVFTPVSLAPQIEHHEPLIQQASIAYESRKIVSQLFNTYILIEDTDGLFLVDQHAAHERILYELCAKQFKNASTIGLLFPHIIMLETVELPFVDQLTVLLKDHSINAELFGHNQLIINAVPVYLKESNLNDLIHASLTMLKEEQHNSAFDPLHAIRAQIACKGAIKAGDVLTQHTMQTLLNDLDKTDNRFSCPHGRPTSWALPLNEIEKKFKRKK